jgi:hypothetical protein
MAPDVPVIGAAWGGELFVADRFLPLHLPLGTPAASLLLQLRCRSRRLATQVAGRPVAGFFEALPAVGHKALRRLLPRLPAAGV